MSTAELELVEEGFDYDTFPGHCEVEDLSQHYKALDRQAKMIAKQMRELKDKLINHVDDATGEIAGIDGCIYATYKPVTRGTVDRKALEADYAGLFGEGSKYLKSTTSCVFRMA